MVYVFNCAVDRQSPGLRAIGYDTTPEIRTQQNEELEIMQLF